MKKIIAILLSIMLAFGVATSALAVADTTESTTTVETTITEPEDPRLDEVETPSDAPATETNPSAETDAPTTSPSENEEPSFLDRIDSAILNFIKEIVKIIGDAWDSLVAFLDQYN